MRFDFFFFYRKAGQELHLLFGASIGTQMKKRIEFHRHVLDKTQETPDFYFFFGTKLCFF